MALPIDSYVPGSFKGELTLEALQNYIEDELLAISRHLNETTALELRPSHAAPGKPREGMIVFADGTDWNPGGGKGAYQYSGGAWVKL